MAHDVFISYSSHDSPIANAVCDSLEGQSVQCWIAPRDIVPGLDWSDAIIDAIVDCKVFLLVLSKSSNESEQVKREVQNAVSERKHIFTFLIEEVDLTKHMRYFIGTPHWMDALKPPIEPHLERVAQSMRKLIDSMPDKTAASPVLASGPVTDAATAVEALAAAVSAAEVNAESSTIPVSISTPLNAAASAMPLGESAPRGVAPLPPVSAGTGAAKPRRWGFAAGLVMVAVIGGGVWATMGHGGKSSTATAVSTAPGTLHQASAGTLTPAAQVASRVQRPTAQATATVQRPTAQVAGTPVHVAHSPASHDQVATQTKPRTTSTGSSTPTGTASTRPVPGFVSSFGSATKLGRRGRFLSSGLTEVRRHRPAVNSPAGTHSLRPLRRRLGRGV